MTTSASGFSAGEGRWTSLTLVGACAIVACGEPTCELCAGPSHSTAKGVAAQLQVFGRNRDHSRAVLIVDGGVKPVWRNFFRAMANNPDRSAIMRGLRGRI